MLCRNRAVHGLLQGR